MRDCMGFQFLIFFCRGGSNFSPLLVRGAFVSGLYSPVLDAIDFGQYRHTFLVGLVEADGVTWGTSPYLRLIGTAQTEARCTPPSESESTDSRYYVNTSLPRTSPSCSCLITACLLLYTLAVYLRPLRKSIPRPIRGAWPRRQVDTHPPPFPSFPDILKELQNYTSLTQLAAPAFP